MNIGFQPDPNYQRRDDVILNDGWFPDLSLAALAAQVGIPAEMDNTRVANALLVQVARLNLSLADVQTGYLSQGYDQLADIPAKTLAGESVLTLHYRHAVYCKTKAFLLREQISMARKPNAESEAKDSQALADYYDTQATAALANLMGQRLIGVELL